jgi:hypothetical protein
MGRQKEVYCPSHPGSLLLSVTVQRQARDTYDPDLLSVLQLQRPHCTTAPSPECKPDLD